MQKTIEVEIGGTTLKIETQRWAKQSNGSALISYKDNRILVTANMKDEAKEGQDFLPLIVDFRENTYAAGKIPGGFFKREGKPSEKEVLLSRLIDRPIRPLFPDDYNNETQIIAMLLSADFSIDYDALGIIGASAALLSSTIPFSTPLGAVKIGWRDGQWTVNPGQDSLREYDMVLLAVGTEREIVMIEAGGNEFPEEILLEGLQRASQEIARICSALRELINPQKVAVADRKEIAELLAKLQERFASRLQEIIFAGERAERKAKIAALQEEMLDGVAEEEHGQYAIAFHQLEAKVFRSALLSEKKRTDGRQFTEIRPISIELGVLPRAHGSAVFTRGETQALATITLGSEDDAQRLDNLNGEEASKRFMLHYNFPPFSVGEVSFLRGAGRREIGHGSLAEKSLLMVVPDKEKFPYTIRVVSDILESNGSSSMATVCGATLALMSAGVPIKAPVAGIAMGLVKEGDDFVVLTDIAGYEDHFGDMDFKIAGTKKGITAVQLDIKIKGLNDAIINQALADARQARLAILDKMFQAIPAPAEKLSEYAPIIFSMQIMVEKIKDLIGPGGKIIKELTSTYNVKINIEPDGKVTIAAANKEVGDRVIEKIKEITGSPEVNKIYRGRVNRIEEYGVFLEIMPGVTGLAHVSELNAPRKQELRNHFRMGQVLEVKVLSVDRDGKIRLSTKAVEHAPLPDSN